MRETEMERVRRGIYGMLVHLFGARFGEGVGFDSGEYSTCGSLLQNHKFERGLFVFSPS